MLIPDAKAAADKEWKEVTKEAHKTTKIKVHFATLMDWICTYAKIFLPLRSLARTTNSQLRTDPCRSTSTSWWMFGRAISSVETICANGIGTLINKMVGDWHQWKVARTNSKSSSSTSTIIEYSEVSHMNSDKSWIVNYVSSLRKKEENFDDVCFGSSKPTVEYHGSGSQDSNNVETKVKLSSVLRETDASTMRVTPASSKSSSGGSGGRSNPTSIHPRTKSNYINKRSFEKTEFGPQFLDAKRAENIPLKLSSSSMSGWTPWWTWKRRDESNALGCHTSNIERKIPKLTGRRGEFT